MLEVKRPSVGVALVKAPSISGRSAHETEQLHRQILMVMVMAHEVLVSVLVSGLVSVPVWVPLLVLVSLQKQLERVPYWTVSRSVAAPVSVQMVLRQLVVDWPPLALSFLGLYSRLASPA